MGQSYRLALDILPNNQVLPSNILAPKDVTTASLTTTLEDVLSQLRQLGYWSASVDSLFFYDSTYLAKVYLGEPIRWISLDKGNVEEQYLTKAGFKPIFFKAKPLDYNKLTQLEDDLLDVAENNGFPFATIRLDSIRMTNHFLTARLHMEKGTLVRMDTIIVHGNLALGEYYLSKYFSLESGKPYSKEKILNIPSKVQALPYATMTQQPNLIFIENKAIVELYLEKKKANRFDFILGFLPQNINQGNLSVTRFIVTGDLRGEFYNSLGAGEFVKFALEQLRPATPRLNLQIRYPYLFKTPFGLDVTLDMFKQDTTFLDVQFDLGIQYELEGNNQIKGFWNVQSTRLLSIDEAQLLRQRILPENLDIRNVTLGLEYRLNRLDYLFNPRKGWRICVRAGAGEKTIQQDNRIIGLNNDNFSFANAYDSLKLQSVQYRLETTINRFFPLGSRSALSIGQQNGFIFSEQITFKNEQFRLGGNRLLRGFDEASIFAKQYALLTLEPRLLLATNSYLYTFMDMGWIKSRLNEEHYLVGIGAGITFETSAGMLSLSLGVGRQNKSSFDFQNPKIHIGYVNLF
jgi:outer membrane translocation and assembly module TamA